MGEGVDEYGHVKGDPENVVVKVDPRYFRPTEVELLLVRVAENTHRTRTRSYHCSAVALFFGITSCDSFLLISLFFFLSSFSLLARRKETLVSDEERGGGRGGGGAFVTTHH